jgi:glucosamine--fructose-6-phosphate aminotransferase (isomerizing)
LIGYENIFKKAKHITIVSCGSSWHASLLAKYYIEEFCKIKVSVEYASEFRYRKPSINEKDIVIGVSQSGETADTLGALEIAKIYGAITVGVCNVPNSSMSKLTDCGIHLRSGVEVGVASTKTFTNQVICLLLLSLWIEQIDGVLSVDQRNRIIADLRDLPNTVEDTLRCCETVEFVAEEFANMTNCLFLGRGYNFPIALEGALKLKEISYVHAEGYPAAEMKHGPIALIDKHMPVIVVANNYEYHNKIVNNIKEIQARDGKIIGIYSNYGDLGDYKIRVPAICDALSPLLAVVPLQLFSYYSARLRGKNVDKPRNLAKSVTVE